MLSRPARLLRAGAAALLLLCATLPAAAVGVDPPLPDPRLEARANALHKQLRCLVCQNQSISDSNAELARDLRQLVRERIVAGDSDRQTIDFIVQRYGDWVLLDPPFKTSTLALWLGPAVLLVLAGGLVRLWMVRNRARLESEPPVALGEDERRRVAALLKDGDRA